MRRWFSHRTERIARTQTMGKGMPFLLRLFSFEGRISRKTYWLSMGGVLLAPVLAWLVFALLLRGGVLPPSEAVKAIFFCAVLLPPLVPALALSIKRLHDRERSWRTFAALVFLAYISIISERFFFFLNKGESLISANVPDAIMAYLFPAPMVLIHFLAPVGGFVFLGNASKFISSVNDGYWDIPAAFYFADSLGGLVMLVAGFWYLWEVGFRPGTVGPNKYGPDPLQE